MVFEYVCGLRKQNVHGEPKMIDSIWSFAAIAAAIIAIIAAHRAHKACSRADAALDRAASALDLAIDRSSEARRLASLAIDKLDSEIASIRASRASTLSLALAWSQANTALLCSEPTVPESPSVVSRQTASSPMASSLENSDGSTAMVSETPNV